MKIIAVLVAIILTVLCVTVGYVIVIFPLRFWISTEVAVLFWIVGSCLWLGMVGCAVGLVRSLWDES